MFDFLKTDQQKEFDKHLEAAQESNERLGQSLGKLVFQAKLLPDVLWIRRTQNFCHDFLCHLIEWQKYSLSEGELEQIRLRSEEVAGLKGDLNGILDMANSPEHDESAILNSLGEIRKKTEDQKVFCQKLIEKLIGQNPLMSMFFTDMF
jgi:hypothetical protein